MDRLARPARSDRIPALASAAALSIALATPLPAAQIDVTGDCTLRDAVRAANSDSPRGDCPAGSGADVLMLDGGVEYALSAELPTLDTPMTLQGDEPGDPAGIHGGGQHRVLRIEGAAVTLREVEIYGGFVDGVADRGGGGILVIDGSLELIDSVVGNNIVRRGDTEGGGIKLVNSHLHAEDSALKSNRIRLEETPFAASQHGGQVAMYDSTATFERVFFEGHAQGSIYARENAFRGGGLYLDNSHVEINNSAMVRMRLSDGSTGPQSQEAGFGADLYLTNGSSADLTNVTIADPVDTGDEQSRIHVVDSDITFNHVTLLGWYNGVTLEDAGSMEATNSLFLSRASNPDFCLRFVGGQAFPFTLDVDSGNRGPSSSDCGLGPSLNPNFWGVLGDNGGSTPTVALTPTDNNPAVGYGDEAFCESVDQRNRPRDADCDSGAYELLDEADLSIGLALETGPPYYEGQVITHTMTVTNDGPSPAYGIHTGLSLQGLNLQGYDGPHDCTGLQCTIDSLAEDGNTSFLVHTVKTAETSFDTTATVEGITDFSTDPFLGNNVDDTFNGGTLSDAAEVSIEGEILTAGPYTIGQTVEYELTIANDGPDLATAVTTGHDLTGLTPMGYTGPCNASTASSCTINGLISGDSKTVVFSAEISGNEMINEVDVSADQYDPDSTNNLVDIRNTTAQDADLRVSLDLLNSPPFYPTNQNVQYRVRVRNAGPDPAVNVVIDNQSELLFFLGTGGPCSSIPCTIPSIGVGEEAESVWTAFFTDAGTAVHTIEAASDQNDPVVEDNVATRTTQVNHAVDIGIGPVSFADPPFYTTAQFQIEVELYNSGTATSDDVLLEFTSLDNLTVASVWGTRCFTIPCSLDYLDIGGGASEVMTLTLQPIVPGPFELELSASGPVFDPFPGNNVLLFQGDATSRPSIYLFTDSFGQ